MTPVPAALRREVQVPEQSTLNSLMREVRSLADEKGFGSGPERIWEMLALIHTEVSEATDAYKKGESLERVGEELTDAVIRVLHLMSALGLDADALYRRVMDRNWQRPVHYNTVRGG
jgi:NTP pyrophosphatase (non-canonical NTP hydrolase)